MSFSVIIPARYASTRLPGKPLLDIAGKPMVQHVYEKALASEASRVVIATDDVRIEKVARAFGAETVMTSTDHPSGTDRLEEVVTTLGFYPDDIVVNVQGDEPLIPPGIINQVAHNLAAAPAAAIATLCEEITDVSDFLDPNVVKVVFAVDGMAMYFSRAPIAWPRDSFADLSIRDSGAEMPKGHCFYRHIGIYAYRVNLLKNFVQWPASPHEEIERLEQLRAMYNGEKIHVEVADEAPPKGVDTWADLDKVRKTIDAA
ncbi:MAG: 3-deoxy-manno-octulosonate cytidylyltransferase [Gammaproteobacteria bacterium]|nr:MAG: 3-deoxy-manno-octulosonate cytidylyltransferase [Gammaproteobacteria bacterium]